MRKIGVPLSKATVTNELQGAGGQLNGKGARGPGRDLGDQRSRPLSTRGCRNIYVSTAIPARRLTVGSVYPCSWSLTSDRAC